MEHPETDSSRALRRIAGELRAGALETKLEAYCVKMNVAADELDVQANRIDSAEAAYHAVLVWR